ncbi:hypothetical protein DVH24_042151 [Malus domestica]|uniref:Uncharacterized protein n=1 Tax=Malus domestica TaxID=3750 RepID=A0A498IXZ3_MALDO|nr:hypothetical protein DVH24_042151 [Malus domestica]
MGESRLRVRIIMKREDGSRGEEEKKRCGKEEEIGGKGGQIRKYNGERRVKRKGKKRKKGGDGVGQEEDYKESYCPETMNRNKEERRTGKKGGTKRETVTRLLREVEGSIEGSIERSVEDDFQLYRSKHFFKVKNNEYYIVRNHMLVWIPLSDGLEFLLLRIPLKDGLESLLLRDSVEYVPESHLTWFSLSSGCALCSAIPLSDGSESYPLGFH